MYIPNEIKLILNLLSHLIFEIDLFFFISFLIKYYKSKGILSKTLFKFLNDMTARDIKS